MIILIPMAGAGSRFKSAGYQQHKPVIPVTERHSGKKIPMVIAATNDLPLIDAKQIIFIDRDFHKKAGIQDIIRQYHPTAKFITLDSLTDGQARTCLSAKEFINNDQELLIAACDNGMSYNLKAWQELKNNCDAMIFTFQNHYAVEEKPEAYGWVAVNDQLEALNMSVKIPLSNNPKKDHAVVGAFWFKKGADFVRASEKMIAANDKINNEFYVDQAMQYLIKENLKVKVFAIEKYICWGTPTDYENYENTLKYWQEFYKNETWLNH